MLQRGLPRPATLDALPSPRPAAESARLSLRERAEELLTREVRGGAHLVRLLLQPKPPGHGREQPVYMWSCALASGMEGFLIRRDWEDVGGSGAGHGFSSETDQMFA